MRWKGILHPTILHRITVEDLLATRVLPYLQSLPVDTNSQIKSSAGLLNQYISHLPEDYISTKRAKRDEKWVGAVTNYLEKTLLRSYAQLSHDKTTEGELEELWKAFQLPAERWKALIKKVHSNS